MFRIGLTFVPCFTAIRQFALNLFNEGSLKRPLTNPFLTHDAIMSAISTPYSAVEGVISTLHPGSEIFWYAGTPYRRKLKAFWAFANWCGNILLLAFSIFSSETSVFILVSIFSGKSFFGKLSQKLFGALLLYELRLGTLGFDLVLTNRTWVLLGSEITILFLSQFSGRPRSFRPPWAVTISYY